MQHCYCNGHIIHLYLATIVQFTPLMLNRFRFFYIVIHVHVIVSAVFITTVFLVLVKCTLSIYASLNCGS